jgi:elongation factor P
LSQEKTFRAGDKLTEASVQKTNAQFSYALADEAVFYDVQTSDEYRVPKKILGDKFLYLKDGGYTFLVSTDISF